MKRLDEKVSIITGAASGMGKEMALLFLSEGAKVVAADINQERLDELQQQVAADGGEVTTVISDISNEEHIDNMIKTAVDTYGRLDVLVNNAGIMDQFQPVADVDNGMWERIMKIDLFGNFYAMRSACRLFLQQEGGGVIVNNGSIAGIAGGRAGAAYTAAKHGMVGLTKNTAHMYAKSGIRCNMIAPGSTATNISETYGDLDAVSDLIKDRVFTGMQLNPRQAQAIEVARIALFLASDDSSVVNGAIVTADSGFSAY